MLEAILNRYSLVGLFMCLPIISLCLKYSPIDFDIGIVYDVSILVIFLLSIFYFFRIRKLKTSVIMLVCFFFMSIVVSMIFGFYNNATMISFAISFKPLLVIFSLLFIKQMSKAVTAEFFVSVAMVWSILLLTDWLVMRLLLGEVSRVGVVSEANYDGLFVLIGGIAMLVLPFRNENTFLFLFFSAATIATESKTGILSLLVITFFLFKRGKLHPLSLPVAVFLGVIALTVVISRVSEFYSSSILDIDRFKMWASFLSRFWSLESYEWFFGSGLGAYLGDTDQYLQWFIDNRSEHVGRIGLYSFHYHSFFLRFISDYGLIGVFLILLPIIRYRVDLPLFLFVVIQGFSLGLLYLSLVSVYLLAFWFVYSDLLKKREGNYERIVA